MSDTALTLVETFASEGLSLRERFFAAHSRLVVEVGRTIAIALAKGGKVLYCGNGGSAADAQHMAGEFVNRFLMERPPLPAIALTTDTSIITAIGNDYSFADIFKKQVQALGMRGDVLVAISTSGNSPNILEALKAARTKGVITVGLSGKDGGEMAPLCDFLITVDHTNTPLIQEVHTAVNHLLCRLADHYLFENVVELKPYLQDAEALDES